tara:strand:+ start:1327 stop:2139 length:813 start_codon:yes stop_codon:yes gene_type:complete
MLAPLFWPVGPAPYQTTSEPVVWCHWPRYLPWVTVTTSVVILCVFYIGGQELSDALAFRWSYSAWRRLLSLFTLQLAHGDAEHLWGNLLTILVGGSVYELLHGGGRVACVYWAAGVTGACMQLVERSPTNLYSLRGASGAAFGILGAYLGAIAVNADTFVRIYEHYISELPYSNRKARLLKLLCDVLLDRWVVQLYLFTCSAFILMDITLKNDSSIAHVAHVGSFAYGAVLGLAVSHNRIASPCEVCTRRVAIATCMGATVALVGIVCTA